MIGSFQLATIVLRWAFAYEQRDTVQQDLSKVTMESHVRYRTGKLGPPVTSTQDLSRGPLLADTLVCTLSPGIHLTILCSFAERSREERATGLKQSARYSGHVPEPKAVGISLDSQATLCSTAQNVRNAASISCFTAFAGHLAGSNDSGSAAGGHAETRESLPPVGITCSLCKPSGAVQPRSEQSFNLLPQAR